jgi:4-oxalocrotonate tautomerase
MPFVVVRQFPGRTHEQKKRLAENITRAVHDAYGATTQPVQVLIQDVEPETWFRDGVPASAAMPAKEARSGS